MLSVTAAEMMGRRSQSLLGEMGLWLGIWKLFNMHLAVIVPSDLFLKSIFSSGIRSLLFGRHLVLHLATPILTEPAFWARAVHPMAFTTDQSSGDIAVIGIGCRFPGDAKSPKEFFDTLLNKRTGWSEVPKDRFNIDAFWHPSNERHGSIVCRGGHFLTEDVGLFDAPFFSMTQGKANAMDPQHRLLLEVAYESLENAGIPTEQIAGSATSCYVGAFSSEYEDVTMAELSNTLQYTVTGNGLTMMSNRLSWFFNLRGPSMTIDTACSSSLVALDLACQNIRSSSDKSRQALVGGVNLILQPNHMTTMNAVHFLSPDSQCFSFDDRANGYTRGEGVGVLVLKHIDDAIRDNDCIRAVIRATGVNQDGKTPGITLPSSDAQSALIQATYKAAGLDTSETGYFEAHGTGTGNNSAQQ